MKNRTRVSALVVASATLTGCSSQPPLEQTNLAKAWSQKLAPYDLVTIFPPRTNVEPGDLYIVCSEPAHPEKDSGKDSGNDSDSFHPIFVTPLDGFHDRVASFFKQRWNLPSGKAPSTGTIIDIPETASGIISPNKWTHLALVSFPEIFQVVGSTTSAGVSAPTGFSIFGLGGQRKKLQTYVLSMPSAEWAGLPWIQAQDQANIGLDKLGDDNRKRIVSLYRSVTDKYKNSCKKTDIAVVQEVYYTRHMTLSFGTDKSSAINAQARLYVNPNQARYNVQQAASQTAVANPPAAASDSSNPHVNDANKDLVAAQTAANAAVNLGLPGAVLTSASVADDGMSFDYHFAAPVAVGAKLLNVSIDESQSDRHAPAPPTADSENPAPQKVPSQVKKPHRVGSGNPPPGKGAQHPHPGPIMGVGDNTPPTSTPWTVLGHRTILSVSTPLLDSAASAPQAQSAQRPSN